MAGSKADYYELEVLKWATGQVNDLGTAPTPYIALGTGSSADAFTEVANSGAYARVSSAGKWAAPSAGSVSNNATISFTEASGSWGTVTEFAIYTSGTYGAGNMLYRGDLTASQSVTSGTTVSFASSAITITEG